MAGVPQHDSDPSWLHLQGGTVRMTVLVRACFGGCPEALVHHVGFGRAGQRPYASRHRLPTETFAKKSWNFFEQRRKQFHELVSSQTPLQAKALHECIAKPCETGKFNSNAGRAFRFSKAKSLGFARALRY